MTSAKSETREENTPKKKPLLDVALHTFKLQSYNITARTSTTKPQTALTNPKLAAEALVVVGGDGSDIGFVGTEHSSLDHRFQFLSALLHVSCYCKFIDTDASLHHAHARRHSKV
jgi:hypothetical protein